MRVGRSSCTIRLGRRVSSLLLSIAFAASIAPASAQTIEIINPDKRDRTTRGAALLTTTAQKEAFEIVGTDPEDRAETYGSRFTVLKVGKPSVASSPKPIEETPRAQTAQIQETPAHPKAPEPASHAPVEAQQDAEPVPAATEIAKSPAPVAADPVTTATMEAKAPEPASEAPRVLSVPQDSNVRLIRSADALMEEATRRALSTLDRFLEAGARAAAGDKKFAVKLALQEDGQTENIWVGALRPDGLRPGAVKGRLANDPLRLKGYKAGSEVSFDLDRIRDWTYTSADGVTHGNFTACALGAAEGGNALETMVKTHGLNCQWLEDTALIERRKG